MSKVTPGPCAKQVVQCHIVFPNGEEYWGENLCLRPQKKCPRLGMSTGQGYELCHEVCQQMSHAEPAAIREMLNNPNHVPVLFGGRAYLYGHEYYCEDCITQLRRAGVTELYVMKAGVEISGLPEPAS